MKRISKLRTAFVLFLLVLLVGGSASLSVTVAEVTFALIIVMVVILVVASIVKSKLDNKKSKRSAR